MNPLETINLHDIECVTIWVQWPTMHRDSTGYGYNFLNTFLEQLLQVNPLKTINLHDIERIQVLYDDGRAVLLHLRSRVIQLLLRDAAPFVQAIQKNLKVSLPSD